MSFKNILHSIQKTVFVQRVLNADMPIPVKIQGSWASPVPMRTFLHGTLESETTNFVRRVVRPGWTMVDVGSHWGYYTLLFAHLAGKDGHVYSFDPDPVSGKQVIKNLARNNYQNVSVVGKGMSDHVGTAEFWATRLGYGKDTMFKKPNYPYAAHKFPISTLDTEIKTEVNILKIDVEGAELLVIQGATQLLKNDQVGVIVEFHPRIIARTQSTPEKMLGILRQFGFALFYIETDGTIIPTEDKELIQIANKKNGINIFACYPKAIMQGEVFENALRKL